MKKYILILACLFLMAGCTAAYDEPVDLVLEEDGAGEILPAERAESYIIAEYDSGEDFWWDSEAADETAYYGDWDLGMGGGIAAEAPAAAAAPRTDCPGDYDLLSNIPQERKVIRNAEIKMEVESIETAYDNILASAAGFGGYEASRNLTFGVRNSGTVEAVIKVPANMLDLFLKEIESEGQLLSSRITSSDVTDEYFASQIRLGNLERTLDRYYEFLLRTENMEEQLQVQNNINAVIWQIEQIRGNMNRWDALVSYSSVTINLRRVPDPLPELCPDCRKYPCECEPCTYCDEYECICVPCIYCEVYPCECELCPDCYKYPCECEPEPRKVQWTAISWDDMRFNIMQGFANTLSAMARGVQIFITWVAAVSPVLVPVLIIIIIAARLLLKKCLPALISLFKRFRKKEKVKIVKIKEVKEDNKEDN